MTSLVRLLLVTLLAALFTGCASYIAPGAKADLQAFAPADIQQGFAAKATSPFPASIAAVRLQADLVLIYTFDTAFFDIDKAKPLSVITLGLSPTRKITSTTTASALLIDTRTGYIYSAYEASSQAETLATSWGSRDAADEQRRSSERSAFGKLVDETEKSWPRLLERHVKKA